jgi:hypothetical protein
MKKLKELRCWSGHSQFSMSKASAVNYFRLVNAERGKLTLAADEVERIVNAIEVAHVRQAQRIKQFRAQRAQSPALPPAA